MNNADYETFQNINGQQYQNLYSQIEIDILDDGLRGIGLEANRINKKKKKNIKNKAKKDQTWFSIFFSSFKNGMVSCMATVVLGMVFNFFRRTPHQLLF